MKILVTGGAGFIGSAVVRMAIGRGHQIVNVDSLSYAANLESLKSIANHKNYAFEHVDIRNLSTLRQVFRDHKPDAVMHLAAESHVDRSIDAPDDFMTTNVMGTFNMLTAALDYWKADKQNPDFRFHHISTDEVYGDLSPTDPAFCETTPYDPSSPYSASKASSDHLVRAWARTYGLPTLITNCSNNYGPYQFPEKLIPVVILKAMHGDSIPVYGSGDNIRDWLYVDDHADALLHVLENGQVGETYNIGGNNERTNLDIVKTLCRLMDKAAPEHAPHESLITFVKDRPGHDRRYAIDASKIERELGWTPSINFDQGFVATLNWYLENRWWWQPLIETGQFGSRIGLKSGPSS